MELLVHHAQGLESMIVADVSRGVEQLGIQLHDKVMVEPMTLLLAIPTGRVDGVQLFAVDVGKYGLP